MKHAGNLLEEVRRVCPVLEVVIGNWDDRATWKVRLDPAATQPQQAAAAAVILAFDPYSSAPGALERAAGSAALVSFGPDMMAARNAVRVIYASLVQTRQAVNALIDAMNGVGAVPAKLTIRTWPQAVAAVRASIDAETDPEQ